MHVKIGNSAHEREFISSIVAQEFGGAELVYGIMVCYRQRADVFVQFPSKEERDKELTRVVELFTTERDFEGEADQKQGEAPPEDDYPDGFASYEWKPIKIESWGEFLDWVLGGD